ncbi:MAG: efflux RND transporter periplasmic adaptor subunit [Fischerella sp.]|jgi:RND family efflux transporter MFP subunit|uniref:efflux RND transporter periplasmic adaptor subunit n=1 Tax=Fischerella sp. TaxID=1191 RepID=UPI00183F1FD8|nr:efflux RND transporter periplasmic adaptor subunit [Fischerella sp.]NWF59071.1 efflux RND transporter periplasmic adaptor subunit [Fischerella sp.]
MTSPEPSTELEENLSQQEIQPPRTKYPKYRWLWLLLALLALAGGGVALWRMLSSANQPPVGANAQPPPVSVKVAAVQTGQIEDSQELIGSLESRRSVTLQPRVQGQVTRIFVKEGETVKTGDPIIQVDPREQQAAVSGVNAAAEAARSQLENARATLRSLEADRQSFLADVKLNQQEYDRYTNLANEGAVSRQTREQYANRLATARAAYNANESKIKAQQAAVAQAQKSLQQALANTNQQKVQLQYYRITAPFAGTVGNIPAKVGDFVNTSTQLATVTQNRPLLVNISVPVERASQLRQGMLVELMDAQNLTIGTSRVTFISPKASNQDRLILIKALFNNEKNQLQADGYVKARVIFSQRSGAIIPTTAVARVAGQNFVYVEQMQQSPQGKPQLVAKQKRVKLGNIKGNDYQVLEGLQPGEKIIVSGLLNLKDGVPINPE